MHYMCSLIEDVYSGLEIAPSAPLVNWRPSNLILCIAKRVLTVFHLFLVLQTLVSSTAELTDLEISGLQEELAGFIMDQVLIMDDLMLVYILKTIYVAVVGFVVWICVFVVMFV